MVEGTRLFMKIKMSQHSRLLGTTCKSEDGCQMLSNNAQLVQKCSKYKDISLRTAINSTGAPINLP